MSAASQPEGHILPLAVGCSARQRGQLPSMRHSTPAPELMHPSTCTTYFMSGSKAQLERRQEGDRHPSMLADGRPLTPTATA